METFTVFCQDRDGGGTTWIESVKATDASHATQVGALACAETWQCDPSDIWVLGVAAGDAEILLWEDQKQN